MENKEKLIVFLFIWIVIIFFIFMAINLITYQREIAIITINGSEIQDVKFGFQKITLYRGSFNIQSKGDLRLNYGIEDKKLNEVFSVGDYSNLGNGSIILTGLKFPENNTWEARFELKDKEFNSLDKLCTKIKFEVINGVKHVSQEECPF